MWCKVTSRGMLHVFLGIFPGFNHILHVSGLVLMGMHTCYMCGIALIGVVAILAGF